LKAGRAGPRIGPAAARAHLAILHLAMLHLALLPLLAVPGPVGPQGAPTPPPPDEAPPAAAPRVEFADRTLAVIHGMIITWSDVQAMLRREMEAGRVAAPDQRERQARMLFLEQRDLLLQSQAGQDMGFPPEAIEQYVDVLFDGAVERRGGPAQASESFASQSYTPTEYKAVLHEQILARTWRDAITGKGYGPTGRPSKDRYLRPGLMRAFYDLEKAGPFAERLGGQLEAVQLQVLIVPVGDAGPEDALEKATQIRLAVLERGADFTAMVRNFSASTEGDGIRQRVPLDLVARVGVERHGSNALGDFCRSAQKGEISAALPGRDPQTGREAVYVYKLLEYRAPREVGQFEDLELQESLRELLHEVLDRQHMEKAMKDLVNSAGVWYAQDLGLDQPRDAPAPPVPQVPGR